MVSPSRAFEPCDCIVAKQAAERASHCTTVPHGPLHVVHVTTKGHHQTSICSETAIPRRTSFRSTRFAPNGRHGDPVYTGASEQPHPEWTRTCACAPAILQTQSAAALRHRSRAMELSTMSPSTRACQRESSRACCARPSGCAWRSSGSRCAPSDPTVAPQPSRARRNWPVDRAPIDPWNTERRTRA